MNNLSLFSSALPEKNKYDEYHSLYIQIQTAVCKILLQWALKKSGFEFQSRSKSREQTFLQTKAEKKFKVHSHSRNNNIPFISPQRDERALSGFVEEVILEGWATLPLLCRAQIALRVIQDTRASKQILNKNIKINYKSTVLCFPDRQTSREYTAE